MGRGRESEELQLNVPSFFRCPISLDVMKSPVSLSTGVTYDRSSIQRWLEDGNNTCPATMQVLSTNDLIPNHTLYRLIQLWSHPSVNDADQQHQRNSEDLIRDIESSVDLLPYLRRLACLVRETDGVDRLARIQSCIPALNDILIRREGDFEIIDLTVDILAFVLSNTKNYEDVKALASSNTISSLLAFLRSDNCSFESRTNVVRVLERISSHRPESKHLVESTPGILSEVIRLLFEAQEESTTKNTEDRDAAIEAVLSYLVSVSLTSPQVVRSEIVHSLGKLLCQPSISKSTAEKVIKLLETASTCPEGRVAICDDARIVLPAIVEKMMKVSTEATEHGVAVLWNVRRLFRDPKAHVAVSMSNVLTKILLLMQSNCSSATRKMAGDLLRISRVNSKSNLASYDTKTTHIMPF